MQSCSLGRSDGEVTLRVRDDGRGLPEDAPRASTGIRGMRERAMLIGARLTIGHGRGGGTEVVLRVPGERLMTVPLKTRVLVADDHPIVLSGLVLVLDQQPDFEVVAQARDGAEAVERALAEDIDLAILDVSMPRMTGLQAAREITQRKPEVRVLILSMHENEEYLFEALAAGASGYVLKTAVDRDLVEACRAAMRGEPFLYPGAVRALIREHLERARRGETAAPIRSRRASRRSSSSSRRRTPTSRSPSCCSSARRPSSATARTSSRSSACATASS